MKKRLLTSATFLLCSLLAFAQFGGSGSGTENDPYLISNQDQLAQVSNCLNQEGVVFKLMKDLDLTNWIAENNPNQGWLPIGVESEPFKGVFLGNNHTISGIMISRSSTDHVGFFGYVSGASITNLTIEGTSITGDNNVGGLIGYVTGSTITNCHVSLSAATGVNGSSNVGGFVGYSLSTNYETFSVAAQVSTNGKAGGFAGKVESGSFTDGTVSGSVNCSGDCSGGFIGWATAATLTNIRVNSTITGKDYSGGMLGYCSNGTLNNSTYEGTLSGRNNVGGLVGSLESVASSFDNCFTKGDVTATGDYVGGLIGISKGACIESMENCSHFGDIQGKDYVGGIVGAIICKDDMPHLYKYEIKDSYGSTKKTINESVSNGSNLTITINNCTAIGDINGSNWVGGIIGSDLSSVGYTPNSVICDNLCKREYSPSLNITTYYYYKIYRDGIYLSNNATFTITNYIRNFISYKLINNYYCGSIHAVDYVGGLVGYKSGGILQNNYSFATIYGSSNVGGIVGYVSGENKAGLDNITTIKSNVSNNGVVSATSSNVGRIYGLAETDYTVIGALGSREGNRALAQTKLVLQGVVQEVEDDLQNGTSIGPSALKLKSNYVSWGWDFDNNWNILETECYPYKKYQAAPPVIESELVSNATSISGKSINNGTVYLYYKNNDVVSTNSIGNNWSFTTEALQSGAQVKLYTDVDGMIPSYFTMATVGFPGSGTEADPYRIYTAEDLQGAYKRGYYKLMNDIDLTSWINENSPTKGWPAIGRNSGEITYIDGDNHKVTGLWLNTDEDYNGLFSNFSAGQIKNLTVEVAAGKKVKGGNYTGILIGRNANGSIVNCSVKGDVEGAMYVGGIAGVVETTTLNLLTFDGQVSSTAGDACVGGVAGKVTNSTVSDCNSTSTITATGANNKVGGLFGSSEEGSITKSVANTTLTASGANNYVGGMIGYCGTPITMSNSEGSVSATGENSYSAGLVGYTTSTITNCYSTADATGTLYTAGLVAYSFSSTDKCFAKGNVNGVRYGAGVVGELDGSNASLTNSVAFNNILSLSAQSSWGCRVIGGYKNGAADPNNSNYALATMQVSLNNVPQVKTDDILEGISKTAAELSSASTYASLGWDMTSIWKMDEGLEHPYFVWDLSVQPKTNQTMELTEIPQKTYGDDDFALPTTTTQGQSLQWISSDSEIISVSGTTAHIVGAGNAVLTASQEGNDTYTAFSKDFEVTVAKAALNISVGNYNRRVGEGNPEFTINYSGWKNNDNSSVLTSQPTAACSADESSAAGVYDIVVSGAEAANYDITYTNGKLTVLAADAPEPINVTDISTLENAIYIEPLEGPLGGVLDMKVQLKNTMTANGCSFRLTLPEGFTLKKDDDGDVVYELGTRAKKMLLNGNERNDNSYDFALIPSTGTATISGNDGVVVKFKVVIPETATEGGHALQLTNNLIQSKVDGVTRDFPQSDIITVINVRTYVIGDVNGDGFVTPSDAIMILYHYFDAEQSGFNAIAADINGDGNISPADAIEALYIYFNVGSANTRSAKVDDQLDPQ